MTTRMQKMYDESIKASLMEKFEYKNVMQLPKLEKIVLNMGVGAGATDRKAVENAVKDLTLIAGQAPQITYARKSIAGFKIREGMAIGCKVTLRGQQMYDFLDRLVTIALPRVRDFEGISHKSFDGQGNYALGIKEQIIFPEVELDQTDSIKGMDIVICTTATNNEEGHALLSGFGMPFFKKVN